MVHTQAQPTTVNGVATVSRICEAPNKSIPAVTFKYPHLSAQYSGIVTLHLRIPSRPQPHHQRYQGTVTTPKHKRDHKAENTARLHICAAIKLPSMSTTTPTLCVVNTQKRRSMVFDDLYLPCMKCHYSPRAQSRLSQYAAPVRPLPDVLKLIDCSSTRLPSANVSFGSIPIMESP
jgi:hypothetical protein